MDLPLRFNPPITFKRLLERPQIDEDGIVYADAYDPVGTAGKDAVHTQSDRDRRQRDQAPSPENVPKPLPEAAKSMPEQAPSRPLQVTHATSRMPGFQAINVNVPTNDAPRAELVVSIRRTRSASRSRSPTPDIPELTARDWSLAKIVGKMTKHGVDLYRTQWDSTMLDNSLIRFVNDVPVVRYRGVDWVVTSQEDPVLNETTGVHEVRVSWEETWHPVWEFHTALDSVVEWELVNNPRRDQPRKRHEWWRWPISITGYRDLEVNFAPAWHRDIVGDEIIPELHCDYTFALLQLLMDELESDDPGIVPHSTIANLINRPLRQRLIFSDAFVHSGEHYRLHREEFIRAATVCVIGHARIDPCNVCTDDDLILPFPGCVTAGKIFDGCCANSVAVGKRTECDVHVDVLLFREAQNRHFLGHAVDGTAATPSSPLSGGDPAARSSVEPDGPSDHTPPTSTPSALGDDTGGGSPELELENPLSAGPGSPLRPLDIRTVPRPDQTGDPLPQSPANASMPDASSPKSRRSRKRKSSFNDGESRSPRPRKGSRDSPRKDGPSTSASSGSPSPPPTKTEGKAENSKVFTHPGCPETGWPCVDPICGTPVPLGDYPEGKVYQHHVFRRDGEADEKQVRFLISRMQCADTEFIQNHWDAWQAKAPGEGRQHTSKYSLMSMSAAYLNKFIENCCSDYLDLTIDE